MRLRRIVDRAAIAIAALALGASVCAQSTYPSKPIRMVGGFPPGGGMDLSAPDIRERLKGIGMDPGGMAPEQLAAMIRADIAKYRAIVKAAGIKAE